MIGQRVKRTEDPALLTGTARFVDDLHLPDMLQAAFVRSPYPHAAIRGIDTERALAIDGVHAVYALGDLAPHLTTTPSSSRLPHGDPAG